MKAMVEVGTAESALGTAEYLVFEAREYRSETTRLYRSRNTSAIGDSLDDMLLTSLYCPVSGGVDGMRLAHWC